MRLNALTAVVSLMAFVPLAHAEAPADPLFGDDPHAKAVLDCHADYARRFAEALTPVKGTPTEVATAAYAACIVPFIAFEKATAVVSETSTSAGIYLNPARYREEQRAKMRDYAFAYTLDVYLRQTTTF